MTRNLLILTLLASAACGVARAETVSKTVNVRGMTSAAAEAKLSKVADQLCREVQDPIADGFTADAATSCHYDTMTAALQQLKQVEVSTFAQAKVLAAR